MSYYLAQSLKDLRSEVDAAHPGRDKASDGWIGDASHSARPSDHNPSWSDGGVVRAIDIDVSNIDVNRLMGLLKKDNRVNYFIYNRSIYGASKFAKRAYNGTNPHVKHIHVSIKHSKSAERGGAWGYSKGAVKPVQSKPAPSKPKPSTKPAKGTNSKADNVAIQKALTAMGIKVGVADGVDGPMMKRGVKQYQKAHGLVQDGHWGSVTQAKFEEVSAVQKALVSEGYSKQTVDGYYGAQTKANVKDYQKRVGLVADGDAGPITRKKLGV